MKSQEKSIPEDMVYKKVLGVTFLHLNKAAGSGANRKEKHNGTC